MPKDIEPIAVETAIKVHSMLIDRHGGIDGVRDMGLLKGALLQGWASFGGHDLYPSVIEKAARTSFELIALYPFVDGNKRIGPWPPR